LKVPPFTNTEFSGAFPEDLPATTIAVKATTAMTAASVNCFLTEVFRPTRRLPTKAVCPGPYKAPGRRL